ncbi:hypothetical protein BJX63DRAFT_438405 [Aspergillus granulosus]|uniref:Uncharacterized protein n=1 Tax=Aspergillus granulosus TaxID=176169 RepID=A0ABR4GS15_9EURO
MRGRSRGAPQEGVQGRITRSRNRGTPSPEPTPADQDNNSRAIEASGTARNQIAGEIIQHSAHEATESYGTHTPEPELRDSEPQATEVVTDDEEYQLQSRLEELQREAEQRREALRKEREAVERERRKEQLRAKIAQLEAERTGNAAQNATEFLEALAEETYKPQGQSTLPLRTNPLAQQTRSQALNASIAALKEEEFPRARPKCELFKGRSAKELKDWKIAMEKYFYVYPTHFATDDKKVRSGIQELSNSRFEDWLSMEPAIAKPITWAKFTDALLRMVNDPKLLLEDAVVRHNDAKQYEKQDVRQFAHHLKTLADIFKPDAPDRDRKFDLMAKILPTVRQEAAKYPAPTDMDYEKYVTHLQMVEQNMPERQKILKEPRNRGGFRPSPKSAEDSARVPKARRNCAGHRPGRQLKELEETRKKDEGSKATAAAAQVEGVISAKRHQTTRNKINVRTLPNVHTAVS